MIFTCDCQHPLSFQIVAIVIFNHIEGRASDGAPEGCQGLSRHIPGQSGEAVHSNETNNDDNAIACAGVTERWKI